MKKWAVATALLLIGVLASACTEDDVRARDAPEAHVAPVTSSRYAPDDGMRGPAAGPTHDRHAHHRHAHHAHTPAELRTAGRVAN